MSEFRVPKPSDESLSGPEIPQRFRFFHDVILVVTNRIEERLGHGIVSDGQKELVFDEDVNTGINLPTIGADTIRLEFCRLPGFNLDEPSSEVKTVIESMDRLLGVDPDEAQKGQDFLLDASRFCWGRILVYRDGSPLVVEGDSFDPRPHKLLGQENQYRFVLAAEMPPTIIQARPWDRLKKISDCLREYPRYELSDEECQTLLNLIATTPLTPDYKGDD